MTTKDLGMVTAYAYAVMGGYEGTEAEFEALLGNIATDLEEIENLTVVANTLPEGSSATASYADGVLTLGIPKGDTGATGAGATATVGTTTTGDPGTNASVTNSGTTKDAVFNFTIPRGDTGNGIESIYLTGTSGAVKTYTILFTDGTTTTFDVTDGEVTNASLAEVLEDYAKVDGAYEQMTVGNAEQLISSVTVNDKVPYNFRTSGGSIDIGNREVDKLVGGTVAWNQLVEDGNFPDNTSKWTAQNATMSISGGVCSFTATAQNGNLHDFSYRHLPTVAGHVVLFLGNVKTATKEQNLQFYAYGGHAVKSIACTTSWSSYYLLKKTDSAWETDLNQNYVRIRNSESADWDTVQVKDIMAFDLTQMFGSTIADYIYSLETATPGAGVAWFKKLFPKDYYAFNAGQLMSVKTSAHQMVGFNQLKAFKGYNNNSSPTFNLDNAVRVINGMSYEFNHGAVTNATSWRHAVTCYDFDGNKIEKSGLLTVGDGGLGWNSSGGYYVNGTNGTRMSDTFTINFNGYIIPFFLLGDTSASTTMADPCVHLRWDGERDGDYEAYKKWTYPLDSDLELRGIPKLDASNNLYYDGDTYEDDGTVDRRFGIVDLGTLEWGKNTSANYFYATISGIKRSADWNTVAGGIICPKYMADTANNVAEAVSDKRMAVLPNADRLIIYDTAYTSSDATAFKTAMSGIYLVYELDTPTTEEADPYQNPQIVDDFGTEEYVDERTVAIPVGHDTEYMNNLKAKLEMAPGSPDGDGDYIVRQTNGENSYVPLMKELPSLPSTDGTYTLKCTVASGVATLGWEGEE